MTATSTRQLLLLRHAKAVPGFGTSGDGGDHGRDLSTQGCADAARLGDEMRRLGYVPELVLLSSALRTRRTWEMLGEFDPKPTVRIVDRLYLAEPEEILSTLQEVRSVIRSVLFVGHNPGLHDLAQTVGSHAGDQLMELRSGLPTCTLVAIEFDGGWQELQQSGSLSATVIRPDVSR